MIHVVNVKTFVAPSIADPYEVVYIGRSADHGGPSVFQNYWRIGEHGDRARVIQLYAQYLDRQLNTRRMTPLVAAFNQLVRLARTTDLYLLCHCAPEPCHGDLLKARIEKALDLHAVLTKF